MAGKKLTEVQHRELGPRIKEARRLLMDAQLRICNGLGTSSKACRIITKILNDFDLKLKNELDNVIFRDYPDKSTQELVRHYYAPANRDRVQLLPKRFAITDGEDDN